MPPLERQRRILMICIRKQCNSTTPLPINALLVPPPTHRQTLERKVFRLIVSIKPFLTYSLSLRACLTLGPTPHPPPPTQHAALLDK